MQRRVGQRFKDERRDELGRVFGHQHMDVRPALGQRMGDVRHFIGSDPAGNAQHNRLPCKSFGILNSLLYTCYYTKADGNRARGRI